mgnify:CR=1 FL=1
MKNYLKKIFNLVKQDLRTNNITNIKSKSKIASIIGFIAVFVIFNILGFTYAKEFLENVNQTGLQNYFITLIVLIAFIFIILSSLRQLMPNKNKDNTEKYLDILPVSNVQRYIAKNITQIITAYYSMAMFLILPVIYFGISQKLGITFYIRSILAFLLMPIIPSIIFYAVMSFIKIILDLLTKNKTEKAMTVFYIFFTLYVYYLIYYKLQSEGNVISTLINAMSSAEKNYLMYIPMKFVNIILGNNALINLLEITGISILVFAIFTLTIGKINIKRKGVFIKIMDKINFIKRENKKNKETKDNKEIKQENKVEKIEENKKSGEKNKENFSFKQNKKYIAYIKREFSIFSRNIELALNTLLVPVIMPVFMIAIMAFMAAGEYNTFLKEKDKISLISLINIEKLNEIKDEKLEKNNDLKEILSEAIAYTLETKTSLEKKENKELNDKKAQKNISIEILNSKMEKMNEEEKKEALKLKEELEKLDEKDINKAQKLCEISLDNLKNEEDFKLRRNKNMEIFKKLQEQGKIYKITEEEKKAQKENDKYKEYVKYELPTKLLDEYIKKEEYVKLNSFVKVAKNELKEARKNTDFNQIPNEMKYLIPIFVTFFVVYMLQISIFMFSKEKNEINFLKTIPIEFSKQIKYKKVPGVILALLTVTTYLIIPEILLNIQMYKNIYFILGYVMSIVIIILFNNIDILLDLKSPNLRWKEIKELVKNSKKVFFQLILRLIMIAIPITLGLFLVNKKKILNFNNYLIFVSIIYIIFTLVTEIILYKLGPKLFKKIEA